MAWLNSGTERRGTQQQCPSEAARRRATAEQLLGAATSTAKQERGPAPQRGEGLDRSGPKPGKGARLWGTPAQ
eukprot:755400-Pyramimonas_sp.AAC.1